MSNETRETLIAALHRLQEVELQLASVRRKREVKARRVSVRQRKVKEAGKRLEELRRDIRERQMKLDALALDVATREDAVKKHREALNKAKTNKEYSNILDAMSTEKADTAKLENGVLALMEEVQVRENVVAGQEEERQKLLDELKTAEQLLAEFDTDQEEKKANLEAARAEFSESVPAGTLSTFVRIAESHEGEAMAPVVKLHPKRDEYGCSGCNMTISLEIVNVLRCRDQIQQCGSCGRILFYDGSAQD